jgi:hypothetical protein
MIANFRQGGPPARLPVVLLVRRAQRVSVEPGFACKDLGPVAPFLARQNAPCVAERCWPR